MTDYYEDDCYEPRREEASPPRPKRSVPAIRADVETLVREIERREDVIEKADREHSRRRELAVLNMRAVHDCLARAIEDLRRAQGGGVVKVSRRGIFGKRGPRREVRIEENGHESTDSGGCACEECRRLRTASGRCRDCGTDEMRGSIDGLCCGCSASACGA